jgi:hypothetical protein
MIRPPAAVLALALALAAPADAADPDAPARGDAAARLPEGSAASEYWDLTARFDSGYTLLVRFLITNQGPGAHTAVAQGYLVMPGGAVVPFKNGREAGKWSLSADRLAIDIGSSELDLHGPVRRFAVDNDKRGVKIHIALPVRGPALWSAQRDGPHDALDVLQVSGEASGTVWVASMPAVETVRGRAALTHAWLGRGYDELARRQIEFFGLGDEIGVYLSEVLPIAAAPRRWTVVARGAKVEQQNGGALELGPPLGGAADYPLPSRLTMRAGDLRAEVVVGRELLRVDPLDIIPQPFRFLLSLRSKPKRIWAAATCTLTAEDGTPQGPPIDGVLALNYANPLPDAAPNGN